MSGAPDVSSGKWRIGGTGLVNVPLSGWLMLKGESLIEPTMTGTPPDPLQQRPASCFPIPALFPASHRRACVRACVAVWGLFHLKDLTGPVRCKNFQAMATGEACHEIRPCTA